MIKNIIIGVLAVALLVYGSLSLFAPKLGIGEVTGPQHYTVEHFQQGFYVGTGRQLSIDNAGLLTTTGGITNTGATTLSGTLTATSDVRLKSSIETGAISTIVGGGAGVITNAQACDGSLLNSTASTTAASTLTLPVAENVFGDCLTTNGDSVTFFIRELSASTTVITAGSGSTTIAIDNGGTVTLGAVGSAKVTLTRFSDTLMWAFVSVFKP